VTSAADAPFDRLDFLYVPSRDVAADVAYFSEVLGGRVVFAIEAMGTRVAAVELTKEPPLVLLADHVEGERAIFVYRVDDLDTELGAIKSRGGELGRSPPTYHVTLGAAGGSWWQRDLAY
jgi:predicted enzyme related to lactoylglutathione lyase